MGPVHESEGVREMKSVLLVSIIILFGTQVLGNLQAAGSDQPPATDEVMSLIEQAEMVRQRASQAGAEWLRTGQLIDQARQHAEAGEWRRADATARLALRQGELALEQSVRESGTWEDRVLR
jgi:hypothetical protein